LHQLIMFDIHILNDMDFERLKKMAEKLGGILVLDKDEPSFVILPYDKYEELQKGFSKEQSVFRDIIENDTSSENMQDQGAVEKLNKEIESLREEIRQREELEL